MGGMGMKTKKEIAEILKLSIPTIDRLMKQGMPYFKIGRSVRFKDEEVLEWIHKNRGGVEQ